MASISDVTPQVLPVWDCVSGGGKDLGNGRPLSYGEETGLLRHHCGHGAGASRPVHPAFHVFLHYEKEPHRLHPRDFTGPAHLISYFIQVTSCTFMQFIV